VAVDAAAGARVSVGVAAVPDVIWVGATVPGASDADPQAITASMVTRQDAKRILFSGLKGIAHKRPFTGTNWGTHPFRKLI
jgi:hypothetical protein